MTILTVALYSQGCPGTHCEDQAGLELTELRLHLPPECWSYRQVPVTTLLKMFVCLHMSVHVCIGVPLEATEGVKDPGTRVK